MLTTLLRTPESSLDLDLQGWDLLIRQARNANLLPRIAWLLQDNGLRDQAPVPVRKHLDSAKIMAQAMDRSVRWEVRQIAKALSETNLPVLLLKGGAYILGGLPAGKGRIFQDLDIMVPKARLQEVEQALLMHGWIYTKRDAYDQKYYRQWMHELPPLRHIKRKTTLDVHHTILPETGPLNPNPDKLFASAVDLAEQPGLKILCPEDMVLHSAVHLFHDGELENGLRDLADLDSLLRGFAQSEDFWAGLISRGQELGLSRPLFYALTYCSRILDTPVPAICIQRTAPGSPKPGLFFCMDQLFSKALEPAHPTCSTLLTKPARFLLYLRGHRLRMPLRLLIPHLLTKSTFRLRSWKAGRPGGRIF